MENEELRGVVLNQAANLRIAFLLPRHSWRGYQLTAIVINYA
jgi:hypothetical protein